MEKRRTVNSNPKKVTDLLDLTPSEPEGPQIPKNKMVIRPARLELIPVVNKLLREDTRIRNDLLCVQLERRVGNLLEGGGDGCDGLS
jgi:hypothetical protein